MSEQTPLLSIILPFFNNEEFITSCMESLFFQIDDNIEVILIDDGSKDNSTKLVRHFIEKSSHTNVKLISQNNGGVAHARNMGLEIANGRYITFLDGDDILSHEYMKVLRPLLESGELDLIDFNYEKFTKWPCEKNYSEGTIFTQYNFEQQGLRCLDSLFTKSMWHVWNRVYKHNLFENDRFETGRRYEDVILTPFLYFKTKKIAHVDRTLYFYRDNDHGITRNIREKDIEDMLFAMKKMISFAQCQPENRDLRRLAAKMIINCFSEVKSMSKAVYGYYFYKKETIEIFREAVSLCTGASVQGKKIWQMRYPQIDTLLSRIRLRINKVSAPGYSAE